MRNEVTWRRANAHPLSIRRFEQITDTLLYYSASDDFTFHGARTPMSEAQVNKLYSQRDERGRFASTDLSGGKQGGPEAYLPFNGVLPPEGRAWAPPDLAKLPAWAQSVVTVDYRDLSPLAKCQALDAAGMIHWTNTGRPRLKRYLDGKPTQLVPNLWADITPAPKSERTGYPTQKPLALLHRIIEASSDSGDVVLDPFAGCATTCVAAHDLARAWVGIDISQKAAELVTMRIKERQGLFRGIVHRTDIPERTDLGVLPPYNCAENKQHLYGVQGGHCAGCFEHFLIQNLTVDHVVAKSKGGTDHLGNLQLLCGHCNSVKGDRGMEYLRVKLELAA